MAAKRRMETQARTPEGCFRPVRAAKPTSRAPAGMSRKAGTKKGPTRGSTSFMATIAVPQKKKGDTSSAHSHAVPAKPAGRRSASFVPSTTASPSPATTHSTSEPVPTHSMLLLGLELVVVLLVVQGQCKEE